MVDASAERRRHVRFDVQVGSRLAHKPSGREFPCQCLNVSTGGARLAVPASMPVRAGHQVRLTIAPALAETVAGLAHGPIDAEVVRVDREKLITTGHVVLAVGFGEPSS